MFNQRFFIYILLSLFLLSCNNKKSINEVIIQGDLGRSIDKIMQSNASNGLSGYLLVVRDEEVVYARGFGFSDIEAEILIDQNTVFDIGSLTKQFTAAAILKLEMEGKISVNQVLGDFFNDIPDDKKNISIHQLLTHTSGLIFALGGPYEKTGKKNMLEKAYDTELRSVPGEEYHYSHLGYNILGAVIEKVTGGDYEAYLDKKLFLPARMKNTGYVIPEWDNAQISHGYNRETVNGYSIYSDWGKPIDYPWTVKGPYWLYHASGGILSTPQDIFKWDIALNGNKILSEEAKQQFFTAHVRRGERRPDYYGYGWAVSTSLRNTKVVTHNAGNGKFYSELMRYIDDKVSIYLCSNNSPQGITGLTNEIARLIFVDNYVAKESITKISNLNVIPDNINGKRLLELAAYNEDTDNNILSDFIRKNFSERIIDKYGINKFTRFLKFYYRRVGPAKIKRIINFGNTRFEIFQFSERRDKWYLLELRFTNDEDKLIDAISFDDIDPIED